MPRSKEIQEQMRNKIVDMYQSGKGYKAIFKALGLQRTTVRAIIHKWRKLGTVVNLPRSGRPTKITPRAQWWLIQEVISGTHWCLHRHLQHLTKSGCCPHMLQSYHHHSSPEEVISILLQWLPSSSTHSYSHEVLWTASHATHQVCPPPPPWTPSSLHIGQIARPMMPSPLPSTQPSHIWTKKTHMSGCCS